MSDVITKKANDVGHSDSLSPVRLEFGDEQCPVIRLDDYSFTATCSELAESFDPDGEPLTHQARLLCNEAAIDVQFRIRRIEEGDAVRAGFYDLSIEDQQRLKRFREAMNGGSSDELHSLSYDDLARGEQRKTSKVDLARQSDVSTAKKFFALLLLIGSIVGIGIWVLFLIQSRSTIAVNNSVIVGNYYPVNTPFEGQVTDVSVKVGQKVRAGQTLAMVYNPVSNQQLQQVEAKLSRAKREAEAYQKQLDELKSTFKFAIKKARQDRIVAEADVEQYDAEVQAATAQLERLKPLLDKQNIAMFEYEEANALLVAAQSRQKRQRAILETLRLSEEAVQQNIVMTANQVSNPFSELATNVAVAEAAIIELDQTCEVLRQQGKPVPLVSPADGTVYSIYRHHGEFLKTSDELLAISVDQGGWATGHVSADAATGVRPGQDVEIEIPSMGITTSGKVQGVGHRSVYGRGGYTADFRGGPLEVPIRVALDLDNEAIPSGLRLNMTVRVRDHVKEFRQWVDGAIASLRGDDDERRPRVAQK